MTSTYAQLNNFPREVTIPCRKVARQFLITAVSNNVVTFATLISVDINLLTLARASSVSRNLHSNNRLESDSPLVARGNARNFHGYRQRRWRHDSLPCEFASKTPFASGSVAM